MHPAQDDLRPWSARRPDDRSSSKGDLSTRLDRAAVDGYKLSRYPGSTAASAVLELNGRLPPGLRDDDFESCKASLVVFLRCTFMPEQLRANSFFQEKEVELLRKTVWIWAVCQYDEKCTAVGLDRTSF